MTERRNPHHAWLEIQQARQRMIREELKKPKSFKETESTTPEGFGSDQGFTVLYTQRDKPKTK